MKTALLPTITAVFCLATAIPSSQAALLLYEGFQYNLSNGVSMNGVTTTAEGLTGKYAVTNQQTGSQSAYSVNGLSFGDNYISESGGSALIVATGANAYTLMSANLNVTTTGSLYSSYLFECTSFGNDIQGGFKQRVNNVANGNHFISNADTDTATLKPGVGYDSTVVASTSNNTLSLNTTYLALSRFTNVGLSGGGTANQFVFTLSGYNDWLTLGGGLESSLASYAAFTASDTSTALQYFNGTVVFGATTGGVGSGTFSAYVDELRYGTTLSDVIATSVPEPSSFALTLGGIAGIGWLARRRK